jgi:hypothetical protein
MAGTPQRTLLEKTADWLKASRPTVTWIYCSAILFPMAFALVAALFLVFRHRSGTGSMSFFGVFYLTLMITLASVPRSILPILLIWLAIARFRPAWDASLPVRFAGLFLLMLAAVSLHAVAYGREFNLPWLFIGWLSLVLPRLAFPMLREGLGAPALGR